MLRRSAHILRVTKTANKKPTKESVNLYLSKETIEKAQRLKIALCRPSVSNVVEFLIEEAKEASEPRRKAA